MKRNNPDTSIVAYRSLTPEKLNGDYKKITDALKVLGTATYEQISEYIQCREPNVVSRRMKELEEMQLIWKPGEKKLTRRNRLAYVYQLTGNFPKTDLQAAVASEKPNISHSKAARIASNDTRATPLSLFE